MKIDAKKVCFSKSKNSPMHNEITLNTKFFKCTDFDENEIIELVSLKGKTDCMISYKDYDSNYLAYFSPRLNNLNDGNEFIINNIIHKDLSKLYSAKVKNIKDNKIEISKNIIEYLGCGKKLSGIVLLNKLNGYKLVLPLKRISVNESTDIIRLNIKHRRLLDIELPTFVNKSYLDKYKELEKYYKSEETNIKYDSYYDAKKWFDTVIKDNNIDVLSIYPVFYEETKGISLVRILNKLKECKKKILSIFIGHKEITLRVIRPYPVDEAENCIRLPDTALKLLGIEEMDTIKITNGGLSCKARVLTIDDIDIISNENRIKDKQEISILVSIPTYMRDELGLQFINTNVTVERDLDYIFRKHLNNQITSIIGLILSFSIVKNISDILIRAFIIFCFAIILLYLSFSEYRGKISNK